MRPILTHPNSTNYTNKQVAIMEHTIKLLVTTLSAVALILSSARLFAYGANQWCEPLPTTYTGSCTVDWDHPEPPCAGGARTYGCAGNKTRTTYTCVGTCKAKESNYCNHATVDGTYVEAVAECVPVSGCDGSCTTGSYGPDSDPMTSSNPECND